MTIYRLDNPLALFFLIIPLGCTVFFFLSRFILKKGVRMSGTSGFRGTLSLRVVGYYATIASILLGMFLIAFSLTKPQSGVKREKIVSEGIDIMIALDVSGSMLTNDSFRQTRIDAAKAIIQKFIANRVGDRIGLVTFEESYMLKCPATVNFNLLNSVIQRIYIDPHKQTSTSIGVGLAAAVNRLLHIKDNNKPESKIVILVTDGINNSGEITPEAAQDIAKEFGIKVYTVGIGGRDEVDVKLLQQIADQTGGVFFHAKTSDELGPVFDKIDALEKHEIESYEYTRFKDIGYVWAAIGIVLMLIGIFLNGLAFKRLN